MDAWIAILLPFVLIMVRVSAFVLVSPIFGWRTVPMVARVGVAMLLAVFFAVGMPPPVSIVGVHWIWATVLILQEATIGLAIGLVARLVYSAVQQGGLIAAQQMGFASAQIIDPASGASSRPIALLFEMIFALLFLSAGGHRVLLAAIAASFNSFPLAAAPDVGALAEGVVEAGSVMLLFALKLAGPMLAGFVVLAVLLCILARVLPEMNILMASFPLRVGLGLFLAAATVPLFDAFTIELARWMRQFLIT